MYENDTISYKVYLKYSESPDDLEVRRFAIDKEDKPKLTNLLAKLLVVFPRLQNENFTINWHDNANNLVTINSDDDLSMALAIMVGPLFKLCILARGKQKQEGKQEQEKPPPQRHDHHIETHSLPPAPTNFYPGMCIPRLNEYTLQNPDISSLLHASIASQAACNAFAAASNARAAASMSNFHQSMSSVYQPQQLSWSHQMPLHQGSHINNLDRFVSDTIAVGNMNIGTSSTPRLGHPGAPHPGYFRDQSLVHSQSLALGLGIGGQWPGGYKVSEVTQNLASMNLEQ